MTLEEQPVLNLVDCEALLAALPAPALIVDSARRIVRANADAHRLCADAGQELVEGREIENLFPSLSGHWPVAAEGFDTGASIAGPDFASEVRVQGAPLCSRAGAPAGWLIILSKPETEMEIDSGPRLRTLLASLDDLVYVLDAQGRVVEFHQGVGGQQLGPQELLGRTYQELLPESFARKLGAVMDEVRATGEVRRFDYPFTLNGEEHWYSANVGLVRGDQDQPSGFVAVARNITHRKRIEAAEREQRALAEALQDVALALNSTLNLDEIWDRILANVERVVPADWAVIRLVEDGVARLVGERGYTAQEPEARLVQDVIQVEKFHHLQYMAATGQPYLASDTWADEDWPQEAKDHFSDRLYERLLVINRSYLGAPILLDGEVIGFINLISSTPNRFKATDVERLQAFTIHAASAIRNAKLYAQAQELAAVNERQRLARDLHDAVSQMLFSAKIIAEMLPRLRERDPDKVWRYLPELHRLIQGAMGEMRTLLLELHPGSLTDVDLDVLLGYLVDAAGGRTSARIALKCEGDCTLQSDAQVAFYRIAQEALANAVKHARAKTINLVMRSHNDYVELLVEDDGCGFEPDAVRPQNLGLGIMRERASEIGAHLTMRTAPQAGTSIRVTWPARPGRR